MKKWYLLFLPLVLIGAGCTGALEIEENNTVEDAEEMITEDHDDSDGHHDDDDESEEEVSTDEKSDDENEDVAGNEVSFDLSGTNFAFDVTEMTVSKDDTVTINLVSESGFHDWVVDELDAATARVNSGESTSLTFVANETGSFQYYCSVGNHRAQGMVGTITVE